MIKFVNGEVYYQRNVIWNDLPTSETATVSYSYNPSKMSYTVRLYDTPREPLSDVDPAALAAILGAAVPMTVTLL